MAHLNHRFARLASYLYKRDSATKIVRYLPTYPAKTYLEFNTSVHIYSRQIFSLILQSFGHLIENMKVTYNEMGTSEQTNRILSKYCSKSLVSLELGELCSSDAKTFRTPFERVEKLTIGKVLSSKSMWTTGLDFRFFRKTLKLNEVFPQLKKLSFTLTEVPHSNMFAVQFPKLEHIEIGYLHPMFVDYSRQYLAKAAAFIENIFKMNQQITNLTIFDINTLQCLKIAVDNLPKLEFLKVELLEESEKYFYFGDKINFDNVKQLEIKFARKNNMFKFLTFKRLNEATLVCNVGNCVEFPWKSPNLRKLHVKGFSFGNGNIMRLTAKVPNLEELRIANDPRIDADSLITYIESNEKLRKIIFVHNNDDIYHSLSELLPQEWKISRENSILRLEKQN